MEVREEELFSCLGAWGRLEVLGRGEGVGRYEEGVVGEEAPVSELIVGLLMAEVGCTMRRIQYLTVHTTGTRLT